jgi:HlyD family secretion protein
MVGNLVKSASDWRTSALAGYIVIVLTFGIIGVWAAVTKIDQAVIALAYVAVESNDKSVQHLEGGIVSEILVREGNHVKEGQVMVRLQKVQTKANSELFKSQFESGLAIEARLLAVRDHKNEIDWPREFEGRSNVH